MALSPVETALAITAAKLWAPPKKLLEGIAMDADQRLRTTVRALNIVISRGHPLSLPKHWIRTLTNGVGC
jgi:hypothetical protein